MTYKIVLAFMSNFSTGYLEGFLTKSRFLLMVSKNFFQTCYEEVKDVS